MRHRLLGAGLVLLIGAATHADYHLGRGHHHPLSLDWTYHWILGLALAALIVWIAARAWPASSAPAAVLVVGTGLLMGQVVEPLVEGVFYDGRLTYRVDAERWRIFLEFLAASGVGLAAGLGLARLRPRRARAAA